MKQNTLLLVIIFGAILVFSGALTGLRGEIQDNLDFDWLLSTGSTGTVPVNKQIDFVLIDKYGGSPLTSKTLKLYDSNGKTLLETLTTDGTDGTVLTTNPYPSGKQLHVYYESSNDKMWWSFQVPEMWEKDAEASSNNNYRLDAFAIGTYTTDELELDGVTDQTDGATYNATASGDTPTFTYTLKNSGSDNTGLMASYDPLYEMTFDTVVYISFSGTGYESVLVYSFPYDYTLGTTHYVATDLDEYAMTKHKEGWQYLSKGETDVTYWLDLTGLESGDSVTMQLTVYAYSDIAWHQSHGANTGYEAVEIAEHTLVLTPNG